MTKQDIVRHIANDHNLLAQIMVSGDSAIYMGEVLRDLRALVQQLQADLEEEDKAESENEEKS